MWARKSWRNIISKKFTFLVVTFVTIMLLYKNMSYLQFIRHHKKPFNVLSHHVNPEEPTEESDQKFVYDNHETRDGDTKQLSLVNVNVNDQTSFHGYYINNDVYVPFKFLSKYLEIQGNLLTGSTSVLDKLSPLKFFWSHTKLSDLDPRNLPFKPYKTTGEYLNFKEAAVANRARVKCISGKYEVPVTTQWNVSGYFYPIQIAQYGLSYLSKYFAQDHQQQSLKKKVLHIPEGETGTYKVKASSTELFFLKIKFKASLSRFDVRVRGSDGMKYTLSYIANDVLIKREQQDSVIIHGIGSVPLRQYIFRDLSVDLVKGLSFVDGKKEGNTVDIRVRKVTQVIFYEIDSISEAILSEIDYVALFMAAADWFVQFQDRAGGWKTNVPRTIMKGMSVKAGWYSAMGQGQAISLLCRVYSYTGNKKYLNSALKATKIFDISSKENGVLEKLFDRYPWYEEYPVSPPQFVLNGFIYSLLGLYDLSKTASPVEGDHASRLFNQGLSSLETLLPLFDNGHGSFYDLRHITVLGNGPNRARWQYHKVHLELLYAIYDITKSQHINKTLTRWIGYASGILSRHN